MHYGRLQAARCSRAVLTAVQKHARECKIRKILQGKRQALQYSRLVGNCSRHEQQFIILCCCSLPGSLEQFSEEILLINLQNSEISVQNGIHIALVYFLQWSTKFTCEAKFLLSVQILHTATFLWPWICMQNWCFCAKMAMCRHPTQHTSTYKPQHLICYVQSRVYP